MDEPLVEVADGLLHFGKAGPSFGQGWLQDNFTLSHCNLGFPLYQRSHKKDESRHKNRKGMIERENNPLENYTNVPTI